MIRSNSPARTTFSALFPILLIVATALALLVRLLAVAAPLGIDQSLWASAVRGLERGQRLYVDVWEQRPPGIYLTYWAAFRVFGWTAGAIAALDAIAAALLTLTLYVLGRRLGNRTTAAVIAAVFALMTMPAWMYRYGGFIERSISETFIVVCVGFAALCGVAFRRRGSLVMAFGIGFWIGGAIVYKPNAAIYFPAILLWALVPFRGEVGRPVRSWLRPALVSALAATVIPAFVLLWLWRIDVLTEAKIAVVDFNRWYVSAGFDVPVYARAFADSVFLWFKTEPLWLVGVIGSLAIVWDLVKRRSLEPLPALGLLWGAAAVIVIVVNGMRLFNTYFVQALAPLALVAGWWLSTWWTAAGLRRWAVVAALAVSTVFLVQRNYVPKVFGDAAANAAELRGTGDHIQYLERFGVYAAKRGYSARAHEELATYVREHTAPDDRIFLIGINGAGVYFLSDRLTAHRFLRVNFFVPGEFPDPRFKLDAVVEDLRQRRPVYLIFERLHSDSDMGRAADALPEHPLVKSLLESYTLETTIEDFTLYRRR